MDKSRYSDKCNNIFQCVVYTETATEEENLMITRVIEYAIKNKWYNISCHE